MAEEDGETPAALLDQPDIDEHLEWIWSAFFELSTDRPQSMGIGAIPFSACDAYARRFGVWSLEEFERFLRMIRVMDRVYLKETRAKQDREGSGKPA